MTLTASIRELRKHCATETPPYLLVSTMSHALNQTTTGLLGKKLVVSGTSLLEDHALKVTLGEMLRIQNLNLHMRAESTIKIQGEKPDSNSPEDHVLASASSKRITFTPRMSCKKAITNLTVANTYKPRKLMGYPQVPSLPTLLREKSALETLILENVPRFLTFAKTSTMFPGLANPLQVAEGEDCALTRKLTELPETTFALST